MRRVTRVKRVRRVRRVKRVQPQSWMAAAAHRESVPTFRPLARMTSSHRSASGQVGRRLRLVHRNGLALFDIDCHQHAGSGRRDFRIDLVGGNLEERLVTIDRIADLLDPSDDGAFGDRLAHLGHHDGCRHKKPTLLGSWDLGLGTWDLGLGEGTLQDPRPRTQDPGPKT